MVLDDLRGMGIIGPAARFGIALSDAGHYARNSLVRQALTADVDGGIPVQLLFATTVRFVKVGSLRTSMRGFNRNGRMYAHELFTFQI